MLRYETTVIFDPLLEEAALQTEIDRITNQITAAGGSVVALQRWGLKRLAYSIKKKKQGYYLHVVFEGPGPLPQELERNYRLSESILRFLTVRAEESGPAQPEAAGGASAERQAVEVE